MKTFFLLLVLFSTPEGELKYAMNIFPDEGICKMNKVMLDAQINGQDKLIKTTAVADCLPIEVQIAKRAEKAQKK